MKYSILPEKLNGGPESFRKNILNGLENLGYHYIKFSKLSNLKPDNLILINGTRKLYLLLFLRLMNKKIILRLGSPTNLQKFLNHSKYIKLYSKLRILYLVFLRKFIANEIIYQSNYVKNDWNTIYGKVQKKSHIIHNPVNTDFFNLQKKEIIKNKAFNILSVEGNQGNDPYNILLNIANVLDKKNIEYKIHIVGKIDNNQNLVNNKNFKFYGHVEKNKLLDLYNFCDCYILTDYLGAGCPNSVLESLSCGCPVVSFNKGPVVELVKHKYNGYIMNADNDIMAGKKINNFDIIIDAINYIKNNYKTLSLNARKYAVKNHSLNIISKKYAKTFKL